MSPLLIFSDDAFHCRIQLRSSNHSVQYTYMFIVITLFIVPTIVLRSLAYVIKQAIKSEPNLFETVDATPGAVKCMLNFLFSILDARRRKRKQLRMLHVWVRTTYINPMICIYKELVCHRWICYQHYNWLSMNNSHCQEVCWCCKAHGFNL